MNWTLLAVILILLLNVFLGYKKGFVKILFSTVSIIVVLIITTIAAPKLSNYLRQHTKWDDALSEKVEAYFEDKGVLQKDGTYEVDDIPLPGVLRDKIEKSVNKGIDEAYDTCNDAVVAATTTVLFSIIIYAVFMLALYVVLGILCGVLKIFTKLPVLKQINEFAGMIIGLLQGLLIIWILFIIGTCISSVSGYILKDIEKNAFLSFLYDKNIFMNFILIFFS